jgi:hypothetical protein
MFSKFLIGFALIIPTMLVAQDQSKAKLKVSSFDEVVKKAAEISGARLVGLARVGALAKKVDIVEVSAQIPKDWAGSTICLSVLSVGGFYQSRGTYTLTESWEGGTISLDYPTRNHEHLQDIEDGGIAPLLRRGACGTGTGENALVFWGQHEATDVAVLLNTSRSDETYLFFPDNPEFPDILCETTGFENRTAFDTVCWLPNETLKLSSLNAGTVSLKRGEMGREEAFTFRLSGD